MYKVEIDISAWGGDEKIVIETTDFEKVQILQEFIDFQIENGWAADYEHVVEFSEEDEAEAEEEFAEEDEQTSDLTVSVFVFDTKADEE
jgi:hypothetical protein